MPEQRDLFVAGGTVVAPSGARRADVVVRDGRVAEVGEGLSAPADAERVDASGMLVLPGVIDVHTHVRLPSEDAPHRFRRDSLAAACGGTTTFLTFNNPGTGISVEGSRSLLRGLAEFQARTDGESVVDFGLSSVLTGDQDRPIEELPALVGAGVPTFKAFMVYDFRLSDDRLEEALRVAAAAGGMLQVHCEEPRIIDPLVADALAAGRTSCCHHAYTRPPEAEAVATRKAIQLACRAEAPLYIVHLSCRQALEEVAEAKARGEPVYAETCPHYLTFTDELYAEPDEAQVIRGVISPPLRTAADVEALWDGLREGILDVVGSDHVPDRIAVEKQLPAPPFPEISNGGPGIETLLSVVYSRGVAGGRIGVERLVEVLATTPAVLFGLPGKGAIEPGRDGDLVVLDPNGRRLVRQADLHHTSDYTPYEGMELAGAIQHVASRGRSLVRDGRSVVTLEDRVEGRFIHRRR